MFELILKPFTVFMPELIELLRSKMKQQLAITERLAEHQSLEEWQFREAAPTIHEWANSMNEFFFDGELTHPSISYKKTRINNLGHYHTGVNDFGLEHELNLNTLHLGRPAFDVATTLLHELVHMYCKLRCLEKPGSYHNKHFRRKMKYFGFNVSSKGYHIGSYAPNSLFEQWLKLNHVDDKPFLHNSPDTSLDGTYEAPGSKLKKFSCECGYNVRVAKKGFKALCLNCNTEFILEEF